jgi:hypothetical protein
MKKSLLAILTTVATFYFLGTLTTYARAKHFVVIAVDTTAKTVTIRGGTDLIQTYHFTTATQIILNGESVTLDKIRAGMRADITVGGERTTLTKIELVSTDVPSKKKKKK